MPNSFFSQTSALVTDIPSAYGTVTSPAIAMTVVVEQAHDESRSYIDGRFHKKRGYAQGQDKPFLQDTYIVGTGGRTGRAFNIIAGSAYDSWRSPYSDKYGIYWADGTAGETFEAVSDTTTDGIEAAEIIVSRGVPPIGYTRTRANTNAYLHLAYQSYPYDYRVAFEDGQAIRLDGTIDGGSSWQPLMVANGLITERYFAAQQDHACRLRCWFDAETQELWVEIGDSGQDGALHHWAGAGATGKIRLVGMNGWAALEYYPLQHAALTVNVASRPLVSVPHTNAASARVVGNSLTPTPADQVTETAWATDGINFEFSAQASNPNTAVAPKISDMTLLVDETWSDRIDGDIFSFTQINQLRTTLTRESQTWDDNNRCILTSGQLYINNHDGRYSGAFGNFACSISAQLNQARQGRITHRGVWFPRCIGIAGAGEQGIGFERADPHRMISLPFADKRVLMMVDLENEVIYDGWPLFAAVRHIARKGNIHPLFLQTIPYEPDGPASPSCTTPVLPRGTGNNPKYRFQPGMSCWSVLLLLAADSGLPVAGGAYSIPYFTGFDNQGQLRFEPYDPAATLPLVMYTSNNNLVDGNTVFPIIGRLQRWASTAQMRSDITVQGLDPISYQLAQVHAQTALAVRKAIGYRHTTLERSARYGSGTSLIDTARTVVSVSSLASEVVRFETLFSPWLNAGATMLVSDRQLGVGTYVVTNIESAYGSDIHGRSGQRQCYSTITGRNVTAYPTSLGGLF